MPGSPGRYVCLITLLLVALAVAPETVLGQRTTWPPFDAALERADSTNQFVLVAVSTPWCGWCQKMKRDVYPHPDVRACLDRHFVPTLLNRDDTERRYSYRGREVTARRLASLLGVGGVPATVLLSPSGQPLVRLSGFIEPDALTRALAYVGTRAYRRTSFQSFRSSGSQSCHRWDSRPRGRMPRSHTSGAKGGQ